MTISNKMRAYEWRERISLYLGISTGLPLARKPEPRKRLSELVRDGLMCSDIQGVPNWLINARTEATRDLSVALDEAAREAAKDGAERYAVIWTRPQRQISEAYVLMPLSVFADILAAEQEARS
jgi:hypothetical protein